MKSLLMVIMLAASFTSFANENGSLEMNSFPVKCRVDNAITKTSIGMRSGTDVTVPYRIIKTVGITYLSFNQNGEIGEHVLSIKGFGVEVHQIISIRNGVKEIEISRDREVLTQKYEEKLIELKEMGICK